MEDGVVVVLLAVAGRESGKKVGILELVIPELVSSRVVHLINFLLEF